MARVLRLAADPKDAGLEPSVPVREAALALGLDPSTIRKMLRANPPKLYGHTNGTGNSKPRLAVFKWSIDAFRDGNMIGASADAAPARLAKTRRHAQATAHQREAKAFLRKRGLLR